MIQALYECPAVQDCETPVLPSVAFDECSPDASRRAEINRVYVSYEDPANAGVPATGAIDWSDASGITTAFDGTNGIILTVIGDKPDPEEDQRQVSNNRTIIGERTHTINATIDDMSDDNYEFVRSMQMGGKYIIWYETIGGSVFGGDEGILANVNSATLPLERGDGNYEAGNVQFSWKKVCDPPREDSALSANYVAPGV